jgi:hypothetical protein
MLRRGFPKRQRLRPAPKRDGCVASFPRHPKLPLRTRSLPSCFVAWLRSQAIGKPLLRALASGPISASREPRPLPSFDQGRPWSIESSPQPEATEWCSICRRDRVVAILVGRQLPAPMPCRSPPLGIAGLIWEWRRINDLPASVLAAAHLACGLPVRRLLPWQGRLWRVCGLRRRAPTTSRGAFIAASAIRAIHRGQSLKSRTRRLCIVLLPGPRPRHEFIGARLGICPQESNLRGMACYGGCLCLVGRASISGSPICSGRMATSLQNHVLHLPVPMKKFSLLVPTLLLLRGAAVCAVGSARSRPASPPRRLAPTSMAPCQ